MSARTRWLLKHDRLRGFGAGAVTVCARAAGYLTMPVYNKDIADIFNRLADLLEISDENPFRIRAYRNAARTVGGLSESVADKVAAGEDLRKLPDIGRDLAGKIRRIVETGTLELLQQLEEKVPPSLSAIMRVGGLGPRRVRALYNELGVADLSGLREAAEKHRIRALDGFGRKTEEKILDALAHLEQRQSRFRLADTEQIALNLLHHIRSLDGVTDAQIAGSFRRRRETVGDLDILVACKTGTDVMQHFTAYDDVAQVVSRGKTRSTIILRNDLQVDLRVIPEASFGAALHYFTGSKEHNIAVRKRAGAKKLKINEYGVFQGAHRIAGKTEKEVYAAVDLPWIEPELRENRGEIAAADAGCLPRLVAIDHIRGDLHAHTSETDGHDSLRQMAEAAQAKGYEYLAITEHSRSLTVARGLDAERLRCQIEQIDRLNETFDGFSLLKGIEVDILADGTLDLPDEILVELDLTICSVHSKFNLGRKEQTRRIVRAMDNPHFTVLGHPTGRLIGQRDPYELDMEAIIAAARERGCFLEVNCHPERLDLSEYHCKAAKEAGVLLVVATDAHSTAGLDNMRHGIAQARRGWLEPGDVLNTRSLKELRSILKR